MRGIPDAKSIQVAQDVTRRGLQSNTAGTGQKPIMTRRKSQASDFPLVDMVDQKATADQQKIRGLLLPVSIDKPHRRKKMQKTMGTVFSSLWSLR
jgi:2-keto-4-pentenoate hydratase/2-oxohepta-3-ene-1,7-dioic acid hydratase in catechol pathway